MNLSTRINAFSQLSSFLLNTLKNSNPTLPNPTNSPLTHLIKNEHSVNGWFTEDNIKLALLSIAKSTTKEKLVKWLEPYKEKFNIPQKKRIGVILAGNIPLVGFHDFISILISGNIFIGKISSKDNNLIKEITNILIEIEPEFKEYIFFAENRLTDFEAIIATGSNNSARYFKQYFGKYPHIIRKNRNSVAILTGDETNDELEKLADDIFMYYGLGCRNVSKIFVPENYNFNKFFEAIYKYKDTINHHKYANNYTYNQTIYLMNQDKFLDNGFLMLKNEIATSSPISVIYYENYKNIENLTKYLSHQKDKLQCVVSNTKIKNSNIIDFGNTQHPELWDYADNVNVLDFICKIK